jgi:hypothetical protein
VIFGNFNASVEVLQKQGLCQSSSCVFIHKIDASLPAEGVDLNITCQQRWVLFRKMCEVRFSQLVGIFAMVIVAETRAITTENTSNLFAPLPLQHFGLTTSKSPCLALERTKCAALLSHKTLVFCISSDKIEIFLLSECGPQQLERV